MKPGMVSPEMLDLSAMVAVRRDLHAHPELGFAEQRTSDVIAKLLTEWGIPVHRGMGRTGVVGVIKSGDSPRAIGLRADMDALPIAEASSFVHASRNTGRMHACGHDGHVAMLLAAARYLAKHRHFDGTIYVIFQPAEEGDGGAAEMIENGLFERFTMQAIFGVHNWPNLPVGQFAIKSGPVFAASNEFRIRIIGKGAHAAMPHQGIDPVLVACQVVQGLQTIITRNKPPIDAGVISVTRFNAGEATHVIPSTCEIRGSVRAFSSETVNLIEGRMRQIASATCSAFDATCEVEFRRISPATRNHPKETEFVRQVLTALVGAENVLEFEPTMAAEDFSFYLLEKPGCYFLIGNGEGGHRAVGHGDGPCVLHNSSYDFNDELILLGGSMWVRIAEAWLSGSSR